MWKIWVLTTLPLYTLVFAFQDPQAYLRRHGHQAQTRVQLGNTTIIGKAISSNVDCFKGYILFFGASLFLTDCFQASLLLSHQLATLGFLLLSPSTL